jgi:hypothetical protein
MVMHSWQNQPSKRRLVGRHNWQEERPTGWQGRQKKPIIGHA